MLKITFPSIEVYDEVKEEFNLLPPVTYTFEHSLISISKWEAKWKKPFLTKKDKTREESIDYIKCMVIDGAINDTFNLRISNEVLSQLSTYIEDSMTATTFPNKKSGGQKEIMTSELIYYYMIQAGIPFECQKWHINRLLTLINVCQIKSSGKKMKKSEILKQNAELNAERRRKYGSSG